MTTFDFDPNDHVLAIQTEPTFDALLKMVSEKTTGSLRTDFETLIVDLRDLVREVQSNLKYTREESAKYATTNWLLEESLKRVIHHTKFPIYTVRGEDEIKERLEWCQKFLKAGWSCAPFIGENCSFFIIPNDGDNLLFKMRWQ